MDSKYVENNFLKEDNFLKDGLSTGYAGTFPADRPRPDQNQDACEVARPNFRRLIDQRIHYHNRRSVQLHALLRALPQEMSRDAEDMLCVLLEASILRGQVGGY